MSELDWNALARVCDDLADLDAADREAALRRLEQSQPTLAREARSLLAADDPASTLGRFVPSPAAAPMLPPVQRIGRYEVEAMLGTGGSATVYRARAIVPPRPVAIKLFHAAVGGGDEATERAASRRFDAEVRALSRLRHPNIATILDAGSSTIEGVERRWIAMELVDGGPITGWAAESSPDRRTLVGMVADLAAAVAHAHARGIIHRDLKPANVLVEHRDGTPIVRVLDFGVARLLEDDEAHTRVTVGGQVIGTVGYLAPEQITGDPEAISTSVDVYALGLILHELLAGTPALDIPTGPLVTRLQAVARARPQSIRDVAPGISKDLAVVVETATARDPADRYASVTALEQDLRHVLAGRPITARPLSPMALTVRFVRHHLVATAVVVAAAVILPTMLLMTMRSLDQARASNARTTDALVQSLDIANEMADAMDRQYGSSEFLDTYYRRQLGQVEQLAPTVAAGTRIVDPILVDAVETFSPPGWRIRERGGRRVAELEAAPGEGGDQPSISPYLRERYGDALLRFSSVLTSSHEHERSLGLRLIGLAIEGEGLARRPRDPDLRREHAFATILVGDTLVHMGDRASALELYQRALDADRALAAERPDVRRHLDDVAWGLDRIANLLRDEDPEAARELYLERIRICERLLDGMSPETGRAWGHALHGRAASSASIAQIDEARGRPSFAEWFRRSERDYCTLAVQYPEDAFYADRGREAMIGRLRRAWFTAGPEDVDEVLAGVTELIEFCTDLAGRASAWKAPRHAVARSYGFSMVVAASLGRQARSDADERAMRRWTAPRAGGPSDPVAELQAWVWVLGYLGQRVDHTGAGPAEIALSDRVRRRIESLEPVVAAEAGGIRLVTIGRSELERITSLTGPAEAQWSTSAESEAD